MNRGAVLAIAAGGMEIAWLYALADFFCSLVMPQPFPIGGAILTFTLGFLIARLAKDRGWRVIYILLLHLGGFSLIVLSLISRLDLLRPTGGREQFALGLVVLWSSLFWLGGGALARRGFSHRAVCSRFDAGIGAFVLFFLLGIGIEQPQLAGYLSVFSFFFFSILALALARDQGGGRREYLLGYQGIGLILTFIAFLLLLGAGLIFLLFPYLTKAAAAAYGLMRGAAAPLLPILIRILRFFFRFGASTPGGDAVPPATAEEILPPPEPSGWMAIIERIMGWGLLGATAAAGLILLAWGIWRLIQWLASSTEGGGQPIDIGRYLKSLWLALWERCRKIWRRPEYLSPTAGLYARLLAWGRRRGLPPLPGETPREYGGRLGEYYPQLKGDFEQIVESFNAETYGELILPEEQVASARRAWRRLSSPFARLPFRRK
ncbi:MAG: DUF4129 domain-containing protein [Firmicutes bacterium]|nr:DUF4129 domain-containing protein [Bacillota bacterium]